MRADGRVLTGTEGDLSVPVVLLALSGLLFLLYLLGLLALVAWGTVRSR